MSRKKQRRKDRFEAERVLHLLVWGERSVLQVPVRFLWFSGHEAQHGLAASTPNCRGRYRWLVVSSPQYNNTARGRRERVRSVLRRPRREMKDKKRETGSPQTQTTNGSKQQFHSCASPGAAHVEQEASPASAASSTPEEKTGQTELSVQDLQESRTSEKFESLFNEVQEVSDAVDALQQTNTAQEKFIRELEEKLNALEVHHRRWKVMDVCRAVAPEVTDSLQLSVDVCHRVGPQREDGRARPTRIRFAFRSDKRAKQSGFLTARGFYFKDQEKSALLWPRGDAARKEGKTARGPSSTAKR